MKGPLSKKIHVTLFLLAYFVSGLASAGGAVFCIGDDGHVGLEKAFNGACGSRTVSSSHAEIPSWKSTSPFNGHCGPCVDVPTSTGSAAPHFRIVSQNECPADQMTIPAALSADAPISPDIPSKSLLLPPPLAGSIFVSLRTVILLI